MTVEKLLLQGYTARRAERPAEALQRFTAALTLARTVDDTVLVAKALVAVGCIQRDLGQLDIARTCYEEALGIIRALDDPLWLAHTVRHVGDIAYEQGHLDEAAACYEEALRVYRAPASPPLDVANALRPYAILLQARGDVDASLPLWQEARRLYAVVDVQAGVDGCDAAINSISRQ